MFFNVCQSWITWFLWMFIQYMLFIALFPVVAFDPEIAKPTERAFLVAGILPATLGVCAAVIELFRRWRGEIA